MNETSKYCTAIGNHIQCDTWTTHTNEMHQFFTGVLVGIALAAFAVAAAFVIYDLWRMDDDR